MSSEVSLPSAVQLIVASDLLVIQLAKWEWRESWECKGSDGSAATGEHDGIRSFLLGSILHILLFVWCSVQLSELPRSFLEKRNSLKMASVRSCFSKVTMPIHRSMLLSCDLRLAHSVEQHSASLAFQFSCSEYSSVCKKMLIVNPVKK